MVTWRILKYLEFFWTGVHALFDLCNAWRCKTCVSWSHQFMVPWERGSSLLLCAFVISLQSVWAWCSILSTSLIVIWTTPLFALSSLPFFFLLSICDCSFLTLVEAENPETFASFWNHKVLRKVSRHFLKYILLVP